MTVLNSTFNQEINGVKNVTYHVLQNLSKYIANANSSVQTSINTLTDRLARGIQTLYMFDSCSVILKFSILLPSGMYRIRSGNTSINMYCSTTIAFSCNGIPGRWKRIAYLNTDENQISCPSGFEIRSDTSNPPLCRLIHSNQGCNSVIYPSNGTSYSQVCGTVRVHPEGTPDGFQDFFRKTEPIDATLEGNYVDGVSFTHGTSPRSHIWTYSPVTSIGTGSDRCSLCDNNKPSSIGTDYTCVAAHC